MKANVAPNTPRSVIQPTCSPKTRQELTEYRHKCNGAVAYHQRHKWSPSPTCTQREDLFGESQKQDAALSAQCYNADAQYELEWILGTVTKGEPKLNNGAQS